MPTGCYHQSTPFDIRIVRSSAEQGSQDPRQCAEPVPDVYVWKQSQPLHGPLIDRTDTGFLHRRPTGMVLIEKCSARSPAESGNGTLGVPPICAPHHPSVLAQVYTDPVVMNYGISVDASHVYVIEPYESRG